MGRPRLDQYSGVLAAIAEDVRDLQVTSTDVIPLGDGSAPVAGLSPSRFDKPCANVCKQSWVKELRYLGIFIVSSRNFKCSLDHAKRSFCRAASSIFGKIGIIASKDVLIELLKTKCMPVLLYGFEVCNLCKRDLYSLDFVVNRFFYEII